MLKSVNPFDNEEIKQQILRKEGRIEIEEAEVIEDTSPEALKSMITAAPTLPKSAKNIIMDANALSLSEKNQKNEELTKAIESVFTKYNEEYGLDLSIDIRNLSQAVIDVGDPKKRQILELYLSETFKSIKPILLLTLIQKLMILIDYTMRPEFLLDPNQFTNSDSILLIEKIVQFVSDLSEMMDEVTIKDSDKLILFITIVLSLFGLFNIVTASSREAVINLEKSIYYYFYRHLLILVASLVATIIVMNMPLKKYYKFIPLLFFGIIGLNVFLIVQGTTTRGASNWIDLGFFNLQPSEVAKPIMIIALAFYL